MKIVDVQRNNLDVHFIYQQIIQISEQLQALERRVETLFTNVEESSSSVVTLQFDIKNVEANVVKKVQASADVLKDDVTALVKGLRSAVIIPPPPPPALSTGSDEPRKNNMRRSQTCSQIKEYMPHDLMSELKESIARRCQVSESAIK